MQRQSQLQPLESLPVKELLRLARANRVQILPGMEKSELSAAIRAKCAADRETAAAAAERSRAATAAAEASIPAQTAGGTRKRARSGDDGLLDSKFGTMEEEDLAAHVKAFVNEELAANKLDGKVFGTGSVSHGLHPQLCCVNEKTFVEAFAALVAKKRWALFHREFGPQTKFKDVEGLARFFSWRLQFETDIKAKFKLSRNAYDIIRLYYLPK